MSILITLTSLEMFFQSPPITDIDPGIIMKAIPVRLHPKKDLREGIEEFCRHQKIHSACILTCVGSLSIARLRMAGEADIIEKNGPFEIVSLVGTISKDGGHFHCALSDSKGEVWGGHLANGSLIYTTAELVLGVMTEHQLHREHDPETGYPELVVIQKPRL